MRAPAFWQRTASLPATLLRPAGALYGVLTARRMARAGERADVPVICVGNFTVGGAGKTPTAIAIATRLLEAGERPFFLTRGYGGRLSGPLRVDPARHEAAEVGDEPLLLARVAPTIVARDRPAGARLAAAEGATVIVMDDGLQNPLLAKDFSIAVVDGATGAGNGLCLPAGPLRAPLAAQWPHVDAVIVIGAGAAGETLDRAAEGQGKPVFRARLEPDPAVAARLQNRRVLAFAGIGRPEKFFSTLDAIGAQVSARKTFSDHHAFTTREIAALIEQAEMDGLLPVTTEKDFARIATAPALRTEAARIVSVPVRLAIENESALRPLLADAMRRHTGGNG